VTPSFFAGLSWLVAIAVMAAIAIAAIRRQRRRR
jgi:hypothetical protein